MNKTVVIPAAGTGSRLGEYTQNYNKAMCTLGPKPVISYIIEKFDDNDELIILLGYKGDLLKQVINMSEALCGFLSKLSLYAPVYYYDVSDNHGRIFTKERIELIPPTGN